VEQLLRFNERSEALRSTTTEPQKLLDYFDYAYASFTFE